MRTPHRTLVAGLAVLALAFGASACDDDTTDTSSTTTTEVSDDASTPSTQRDRDQDRDRIHQAVLDLSDACRDQDQDRLRDQVADQLRDQIRDRLQDGSCLLDGAEDIEVADETIEVDGDTATVRFTLRYRAGDAQHEDAHTWMFRWTAENGWVLSDLDSLFDAAEG